jgi:hypothetical protein
LSACAHPHLTFRTPAAAPSPLPGGKPAPVCLWQPSPAGLTAVGLQPGAVPRVFAVVASRSYEKTQAGAVPVRRFPWGAVAAWDPAHSHAPLLQRMLLAVEWLVTQHWQTRRSSSAARRSGERGVPRCGPFAAEACLRRRQSRVRRYMAFCETFEAQQKQLQPVLSAVMAPYALELTTATAKQETAALARGKEEADAALANALDAQRATVTKLATAQQKTVATTNLSLAAFALAAATSAMLAGLVSYELGRAPCEAALAASASLTDVQQPDHALAAAAAAAGRVGRWGAEGAARVRMGGESLVDAASAFLWILWLTRTGRVPR